MEDVTCQEHVRCMMQARCYTDAPGSDCASENDCSLADDADDARALAQDFETCARTECAEICEFVEP